MWDSKIKQIQIIQIDKIYNKKYAIMIISMGNVRNVIRLYKCV